MIVFGYRPRIEHVMLAAFSFENFDPQVGFVCACPQVRVRDGNGSEYAANIAKASVYENLQLLNVRGYDIPCFAVV